ncbi:hypothetical protein PIB30_036783 [Stylosanthes scabra]|uniref:Uncharacterized protein n=1 Tax=Stylosanthes scabra TaxID=79078 RepID=A0ABU6XCB8_9FABA|nr:hypothetical protein [Stylosanthes scabra]
MKAMRATYNYMIQPVPSKEYWTPISCEGIVLPPIVCLPGWPRDTRIKDHVDMIIGNKGAMNCDQGNSRNAQPPLVDLVARKSKKKKLRIVVSADIGQAKEMNFSQSTPTPEEPASLTPGPFATPPTLPP